MSVLSRNHFELFGLPERYALDAQSLDLAFRSVQTAVHPDRFAAATPTDRRIAMQLATQANEAYRTLRDPASRGVYLCGLHGVDVALESNTAMPPEFLMRQMEWREALDEAREAADIARLEALRDELLAGRDELFARLADAIDARADYQDAAADLRQLMFLDRFAEEIESVEERIQQTGKSGSPCH